MVRLAVTGAAGKTGRRIIALADERDEFTLVAALERAEHACLGCDAGVVAGIGDVQVPIQAHADVDFDVLIDFSSPAGTMRWLERCLSAKRAIVIGTTGHAPEQIEQIDGAAKTIPVLKAANMSVGVNLMLKLAGQITASLGDDYDVEIVETHHRFKLDAPSGTALALRDVIIEVTGRDADRDVIYGRQGATGKRPRQQIGIHALRVGDTIGEHEVHFGNLGETLVLKHAAHTRDTFASGALRAAAWLAGKPVGRYDMHDVLGL